MPKTSMITNDFPAGRTIVGIRNMTPAEMNREYWFGEPATVLVLDDGSVLYPSQDFEGNGPGAIFGFQKGKSIALCVQTSGGAPVHFEEAGR